MHALGCADEMEDYEGNLGEHEGRDQVVWFGLFCHERVGAVIDGWHAPRLLGERLHIMDRKR